MTTRKNFLVGISDRTGEVLGAASQPEKDTNFRDAAIFAGGTFIVAVGLIVAFTQSIGVVLFLGYLLGALAVMGLVSTPFFIFLWFTTKGRDPSRHYGRRVGSETDGLPPKANWGAQG